MSSWLSQVARLKELRRRDLVSGLGLAALMSAFPSLASAASPTLKPARVGQKIVWRGYTYTVIRSKGKLVWKRGAKVAVATASAKATASPTATATPTASATPSPTASATPSPTATATPTPSPTASATPKGIVVAKSTDIKEGTAKIVEARNSKGQFLKYSLSRFSGQVRALSTVCTHQGCVVVVEKQDLVCNCHLSYFSSFDGAVQSGPARLPLTQYTVAEQDGQIYLDI